jgi:hypothetical protein
MILRRILISSFLWNADDTDAAQSLINADFEPGVKLLPSSRGVGGVL